MSEHPSRNRVFADDDDHLSCSPQQDLNPNPRPALSAQTSHYWNHWRDFEKQYPDNWGRTKRIRGDIEIFESGMKPLQELERALWKEYMRSRSGSPEDKLNDDELRKAVQERVTAGKGDTFSVVIEGFEQTAGRSDFVSHSSPPGEKAVKYLHQLERLRYKKARCLDELCEWLRVPNAGQSSERDPAPQVISNRQPTFGLRFWAVIVGINYYPHLPQKQQLYGCVNDTRLVYRYLTDDLGVPEDHILVLKSEHGGGKSETLPTRDGIVDALYQHLRDNPLVQKNDNLLFHYSGHGASYERELGSLRTEALCPCDRPWVEEDLVVPDISDRELNIIFSEISRKTGANLTIILDCCHSGGATRKVSVSDSSSGGTTSELSTVRGIGPLLVYGSSVSEKEILEAARKEEPDPREKLAVKLMFERARDDPRRMSGSQSPFVENWKADMSSHVLLAACRTAETAKEVRGFGVLSSALFSALTSPRGRDPAMTYLTLFQEVIQRPYTQTPIVVGKRKNSRLWFQEGEIPEPLVKIRSLSS